jgi:hypothetical protein
MVFTETIGYSIFAWLPYESTQALTEINTKAFTQLTEQQQALGYVIPRGLPYCPLY